MFSVEVCLCLNIATAKIGANEHYTELDSHADMCVLGRNAKITHKYKNKVSVTGYDKTMGERQYNIVSGKIAYDNPMTGQPTIVEVNQAIYIPTMSHNLLSPMQLLLNGVKINTKAKIPPCNANGNTARHCCAICERGIRHGTVHHTPFTVRHSKLFLKPLPIQTRMHGRTTNQIDRRLA